MDLPTTLVCVAMAGKVCEAYRPRKARSNVGVVTLGLLLDLNLVLT